jgi:hypothetical protein
MITNTKKKSPLVIYIHTVYKHPGIFTNLSMVPETGEWKRW